MIFVFLCKENTSVLLMGSKLVHPLWRTAWRLLKKLKTELPYNAAISLPDIYLEKMKTLIWKDTHSTPIFTTALFTIAKTWKQPKCLPTDEWIKKMWYACVCAHTHAHAHTHTHTHTLEYYLAINKNGIMSSAVTWMWWLLNQSPSSPPVFLREEGVHRLLCTLQSLWASDHSS